MCQNCAVCVCVCVCVYRPLRADEHLPVLTHRLAPDTVTDDKDIMTSHRRHKKKDRKVVRSFVRYCGQGSSLLWTPALRPLHRSNAPAQGEEGNW